MESLFYGFLSFLCSRHAEPELVHWFVALLSSLPCGGGALVSAGFRVTHLCTVSHCKVWIFPGHLKMGCGRASTRSCLLHGLVTPGTWLLHKHSYTL